MKVEIYTRGPSPKMIWRGELDQVPRVGDDIVILDYLVEEVVRVVFNFVENVIRIEVMTFDLDNIYQDLDP